MFRPLRNTPAASSSSGPASTATARVPLLRMKATDPIPRSNQPRLAESSAHGASGPGWSRRRWPRSATRAPAKGPSTAMAP